MPTRLPVVLLLLLSGCPEAPAAEQCPHFVVLDECADAIAAVYDDNPIFLCCKGALGSPVGTGAVCDAMMSGGFDECVIEACHYDDPCLPTAPLCVEYFDYLHHNTAGCVAPESCTVEASTCGEGYACVGLASTGPGFCIVPD